MVQSFDVKVENDHLYKLTNVRPIKGLEELIWNSLDADAKNINIKYSDRGLNKIDYIDIIDDGHGIDKKTAIKEFQFLGGSHKKTLLKSPGQRKYHGCEGQGRFKAFSLGNFIKFHTVFIDQDDEQLKHFDINLNIENVKKFVIDDLQVSNEPNSNTGTRVFGK